MSGQTVLAVAAPLLVARYIEGVADAERRRFLVVVGAGFVSICIMRAVVSTVVASVGERLAWESTNGLRLDLLRCALHLTHAETGRETATVLVDRVENDPARLERVFSQLFFQLLAAVVLSVTMVLTVAPRSLTAAGVLVVYVAGAAVVLIKTQRLATRYSAAAIERQSAMLSLVGEAAANAEAIRLNGGSEWLLAQFRQRIAHWLPLRLRTNQAAFTIWTTSIGTHAVGVAIALTLGITVLRGRSHMATVFLVLQYMDALRQPLEAVRVELQTLPEATAAARRLRQFELRPQIEHARPVPGWVGHGATTAVSVRDVSFAYSPGQPKVLDAVTLDVAAGASLAVVGRTGSGKSTLLRLLLGYLEPDAGTVLVGGMSPARIGAEQRWSVLCAVPQRPRLFRATIRDNVTLFDHRWRDRVLEDLFGRLGLAEWLEQRVAGLDDEITELDDLSTGEAHLLAIARVLLRDPPIVLLDEITSALDPSTEARVLTGLRELVRGRTSITVTHRREVFAGADAGLLLAQGRVVAYEPLSDRPAANAVWARWKNAVEVSCEAGVSP